jgi:hypothetical protein
MAEKRQSLSQTRVDRAAVESPDEVAVPMEKILAEIGQDSRRRPQEYLDQVRVPFGGE